MNSLIWTAPEHMYTEKTTDWYWIVGIITTTFTIISIIFGNTLFGILIVVGACTLALHASHPPKMIPIKITEKGVQVNDIFYPYDSLESFWVEEKELHPRILLKSTSRFAPYIVILLGDAVTAEEVRETLDIFLHEVKHSEPFLEKLLVWFGF